jgi:hypothetical protein
MIVYGWTRPTILLAVKNDLCATCSVAGPHAIVRRVHWASIFFVPVLPFWMNHRLVCGSCGAETKLGYRQVRAALKSGNLPLPPRSNYPAFAKALFDANERRPAEREFDPIERNPNRSGWQTYGRLWTVVAGLVAVLFVVAMVTYQPSPPSAPAAAPGATPAPTFDDTPGHTCWLAADGSINGCEMRDGTIVGVGTGKATVCYFDEPLPTGDYSVRCRS